MILVSAPAGSGKTVLLRSWLNAAGLSRRAAWVSVERNENSPQSFWRGVVASLQDVMAGEGLALGPAPTPDFDGKMVVEHLLSALTLLDEPASWSSMTSTN